MSDSHAPPEAHSFSMREARSLLSEEDLRPNLKRYWVDLLLSWAGLQGAIELMQHGTTPLPLRAIGFVGAVLLGYRCALFIHELAHQPDRQFGRFRFAWNLLVGIPLLIPSFVYSTHLEHHRRRSYGTSHDGEYLPFGSRPVWQLVAYLAGSFVIPPLAVLRFGVLTPLTWLGRGPREWVHRHASSMVIDPAYVRPLPSDKQLRAIRLQEAACFGFLLISAGVIVSTWFGYLRGLVDPWLAPQLYAVAVTAILMNAVRTIGAHRYYYDHQEANDAPMSFTEQLLDSVNYPRPSWLTTLWAPIGQRYHALHHLFPTMPYHALSGAHERLMAGLPEDSPYRQTNSPSLGHALTDLWRRARASRRGEVAKEAAPELNLRQVSRRDAEAPGE